MAAEAAAATAVAAAAEAEATAVAEGEEIGGDVATRVSRWPKTLRGRREGYAPRHVQATAVTRQREWP